MQQNPDGMIRGAATPQNFWRHCVLQLPANYNNETSEWDKIYNSYEVGPPVMPLLVCLCVSWLMVCLTLAGGIKSSGKVSSAKTAPMTRF